MDKAKGGSNSTWPDKARMASLKHRDDSPSISVCEHSSTYLVSKRYDSDVREDIGTSPQGLTDVQAR